MKSWQIDIRVCQCCLYLGNKKMFVMVRGGVLVVTMVLQ